MIRAILLDLDETLLGDHDGVLRSLAATCASIPQSVDPIMLARSLWNHAAIHWETPVTQEASDRFGFGPIEGLLDDFATGHPAIVSIRKLIYDYQVLTWQAVLRDLGIYDHELANRIAARFKRERRDHCVLFRKTEIVLRILESRYSMALVTNGPSALQRMKIAQTGIERYFSAVSISGEVGVAKPMPEIFVDALGRLGVCAEDSIMVGDHYDRDIAGARAVGIWPVWLNRSPTKSSKDVPCDVIRSLEDLPALLQSTSERRRC